MRKWFTCYIGGCCSLLFFAITAFGQNLRVTGVVTDARTGETLIGVSVLVKGTATGAQTCVNGDYAINASPNSARAIFPIPQQQIDLSVGQLTQNQGY